MRYLAIRPQAAGPASRVCRMAAVLVIFVCGTSPVARADLPQDLWGTPYSASQVQPGIWQPPATEHSEPSLSEKVFGDSGGGASSPIWHGYDAEPRTSVVPAQYVEGDWMPHAVPEEEPWTHQILPDGLIYRSYLAGVKESRFAGQWVHDTNLGWMWDITLGGRVPILRYGTTSVDHPEGWQIDMEGAGMPRLDLEHEERDLIAADFRFGVPLTYGRGNYQSKLAYYHLSSHLGDEYMVRYSTLLRRNYSRDVIVWGHSYYLTPDLRFYGEAGWAFNYDGGSKPWEFQMGVDYSPARLTGQFGAPFFAVNGYLREEFDFGGNFVVQTGWQWRGQSGHLFRIGMHYFQGMSDQWEFFDQYEDKLGFGVWYDF